VWQPWHDAAACIGACGVWQLVQRAWLGVAVATSVGFTPWQPMQTRDAWATKSCGL
jgi:hypothetical protein